MKGRFHAVKQEPDTRAIPFKPFGAQCYEERFDIAPSDTRVHRIGKDGFKDFPVFVGHKYLVSIYDISVNNKNQAADTES